VKHFALARGGGVVFNVQHHHPAPNCSSGLGTPIRAPGPGHIMHIVFHRRFPRARLHKQGGVCTTIKQQQSRTRTVVRVTNSPAHPAATSCGPSSFQSPPLPWSSLQNV
ncbi:unnamed protein product, partial [Ectocarpus sp. 8 AP-2014]